MAAAQRTETASVTAVTADASVMDITVRVVAALHTASVDGPITPMTIQEAMRMAVGHEWAAITSVPVAGNEGAAQIDSA